MCGSVFEMPAGPAVLVCVGCLMVLTFLRQGRVLDQDALAVQAFICISEILADFQVIF